MHNYLVMHDVFQIQNASEIWWNLPEEYACIQNTGGFKGVFLPEKSAWIQNTGEVGWLFT